ncbi:transposase [Salinimonas marina]|uniref:Transposase n=1 Tax=Salinimonas marina TaxID=2785918 RepID=A0A7S9DX49_9ALTE|nr:transposase [Salinimonas marina]QPG05592.1 transposase [Salinimonas marina]
MAVLADDDDKQIYLAALSEYAERYEVAIHAWGMTATQLQILVTPQTSNGISSMLQATGRMYAQHFNTKYDHRGGIWQDRYKASLILSDEYSLAVYRYIDRLMFCSQQLQEQTPPSLYSSAQENKYGSGQSIVTPHPSYQALGDTPSQRQQAYHALCATLLPAEQVAQIEKALRMSLALGDEHFIKRLEHVTGRRLLEGKPGRPRKTPARNKVQNIA